VFRRKVKVDTFTAEVDQAAWRIHWFLTASYTIFPDEDGYAAADYRVSTSRDQETGDLSMSLTGKIAAATDVLALAKLDTIIKAAETGGWTASHLIREDQDKNLLLPDPDNDEEKEVFIELTFSRHYRRRAADVLSYTMTISDGEEARNGLIQRTYSGSMTACGSTDSAAYNAAVAKAIELGANKHPLMLTSRLTRNDRQVSGGAKEFVRLEFSFDYQVKSKRVWAEINSETSNEVFGESMEQISGSIVAETFAAARDIYQTKVRNLYNDRHVRNERTTESKALVDAGAYGPAGFTSNGTFTEIPAKLDFAFSVWNPKPTGSFALKYGMEVEIDYVALRRNAVVRGRVFADQATLEAIKAGSDGNKLDAFLSAFNLGKLVSTSRSYEYEQDGVDQDVAVAVEFRNTYINSVTSPNLILASEVSEEIVYSGKRWVFQPVPDDAVVPQECGIEAGKRTVTGSVTAATEAEGMRFVRKMHSGPGSLWNTFPSGIGGGAKPATRYEDQVRINRTWETLPLTELALAGNGSANRMSNAQFFKATFTFSETMPRFAANSIDF
jgi:hypothetical protein